MCEADISDAGSGSINKIKKFRIGELNCKVNRDIRNHIVILPVA